MLSADTVLKVLGGRFVNIQVEQIGTGASEQSWMLNQT